MSLAAVLHHANHTLDSIVLLHSAIDTCEEYSVYHFLLGNLYAVSAPYSSVDSFFSLQNAQLQLSAQSLLLHLTFRLTIFFKFGFLGQSNGRKTVHF